MSWLHEAFPDAEIYSLEESSGLRRQLKSMKPDRTEIGAVYKQIQVLTGVQNAPLRSVSADVLSGKTGFSPDKVMTSLVILDELKLVRYDPGRNVVSWQSSEKCHLNDAPLMRYLNPFC